MGKYFDYVSGTTLGSTSKSNSNKTSNDQGFVVVESNVTPQGEQVVGTTYYQGGDIGTAQPVAYVSGGGGGTSNVPAGTTLQFTTPTETTLITPTSYSKQETTKDFKILQTLTGGQVIASTPQGVFKFQEQGMTTKEGVVKEYIPIEAMGKTTNQFMLFDTIRQKQIDSGMSVQKKQQDYITLSPAGKQAVEFGTEVKNILVEGATSQLRGALRYQYEQQAFSPDEFLFQTSKLGLGKSPSDYGVEVSKQAEKIGSYEDIGSYFLGLGFAASPLTKITSITSTGYFGYQAIDPTLKAFTSPSPKTSAEAFVSILPVASVGAGYITKRVSISKSLNEQVSKLSPSEKALFISQFEEAKQLRSIQPKVKDISLIGMERIPVNAQGIITDFLGRKKVVVGGSVAQRTQLYVKEAKAPSDIDVYVRGLLQEYKTGSYAKQLAKQLKEAGVERVSVVDKTKITIKGKKAIEFLPLDDYLKFNLEQILPIYRTYRAGITKTPKGVKVQTLGTQLQRKLVGAYLDTGRYSKDFPSAMVIRQSLRKTKKIQAKLGEIDFTDFFKDTTKKLTKEKGLNIDENKVFGESRRVKSTARGGGYSAYPSYSNYIKGYSPYLKIPSTNIGGYTKKKDNKYPTYITTQRDIPFIQPPPPTKDSGYSGGELKIPQFETPYIPQRQKEVRVYYKKKKYGEDLFKVSKFKQASNKRGERLSYAPTLLGVTAKPRTISKKQYGDLFKGGSGFGIRQLVRIK